MTITQSEKRGAARKEGARAGRRAGDCLSVLSALSSCYFPLILPSLILRRPAMAPDSISDSVRYDSDHPRVAGDVGMAGVAIDSVEDMKVVRYNNALAGARTATPC